MHLYFNLHLINAFDTNGMLSEEFLFPTHPALNCNGIPLHFLIEFQREFAARLDEIEDLIEKHKHEAIGLWRIIDLGDSSLEGSQMDQEAQKRGLKLFKERGAAEEWMDAHYDAIPLICDATPAHIDVSHEFVAPIWHRYAARKQRDFAALLPFVKEPNDTEKEIRQPELEST